MELANEDRFMTLDNIWLNKLKVAVYNRRVKHKKRVEGNLVLKIVLQRF